MTFRTKIQHFSSKQLKANLTKSVPESGGGLRDLSGLSPFEKPLGLEE